jgi:hypothetical protein
MIGFAEVADPRRGQREFIASHHRAEEAQKREAA